MSQPNLVHDTIWSCSTRLNGWQPASGRSGRRAGRSTNAPTRSRTPRRDWAEIKGRRRWRRWSRRFSLKNVLRDVALPRSDVPIGMADIRVPDDRVHTKITGLHRRISWAPVTWPFWVVVRATGPSFLRQHRARLGLGGTRCQPQSGHRDGARQQRPGDHLLGSVVWHGRSLSGRLDDDHQYSPPPTPATWLLHYSNRSGPRAQLADEWYNPSRPNYRPGKQFTKGMRPGHCSNTFGGFAAGGGGGIGVGNKLGPSQ
jgi:hypothetical protein